jgi:hypothetical protein
VSELRAEIAALRELIERQVEPASVKPS